MNPLAALARRSGKASWFPPVAKRLVPLDEAVQRRTNGRFSLLSLAGVDGLLLTTVGRRSGARRTVALLYVPGPDGYVVAGSNYGGSTHPGWSANLLARPEAEVTAAGKTVHVRARFAEGAERERLWPLLTARWPAYDTYAGRAGRDIRVFTLVPAGS
jgi:deazaflavin-dependent oxidoreductase (nitroreductase family)